VREGLSGVWSCKFIETGSPAVIRVAVMAGRIPLSFGAFIEALGHDADFRRWFNSSLADLQFAVFRWETPPVTSRTASREFEFVALDSPGLDLAPDSDAFEEHFRNGYEPVLTFPNLGGDALMIVPRPIVAHSAYGHLASFVRRAPESQQDALWQAVGDAMARRLGAKPVWLSTAGGGVPWLHVRLDDRPKYYGYAAYRECRA
jgi:hypothetical protein